MNFILENFVHRKQKGTEKRIVDRFKLLLVNNQSVHIWPSNWTGRGRFVSKESTRKKKLEWVCVLLRG